MTIRRIGIPSIPAGFNAEEHSLFSAMRQELLRLDRLTQEQVAELDRAVQYSEGAAPSLGIGSGVVTLTPRNGAFQEIINNGAFTLQPPTENCALNLLVINGAAAGAITITGFSRVTGTAAPPSNGTTSAHRFMARVTVINAWSWLEWQALQ